MSEQRWRDEVAVVVHPFTGTLSSFQKKCNREGWGLVLGVIL
jgi:hypothetical protein